MNIEKTDLRQKLFSIRNNDKNWLVVRKEDGIVSVLDMFKNPNILVFDVATIEFVEGNFVYKTYGETPTETVMDRTQILSAINAL